jgi:hypothetical protein
MTTALGGGGQIYTAPVRDATIAIALGVTAASCTSEGTTICERTGRCVSIGDGATPIAEAAPLEPAQQFAPPVYTADAISSTFGPRWKLSAQRDDFHLGIDYFGALGTPLLAIGDGVVSDVYQNSPVFPDGGNVIVVEHAIPSRSFHNKEIAKLFAVYLHADTIAVTAGAPVTRGQTIGTMGMTGDTDFVHLHFETRVGTVCSLIFQSAHPGTCATGFDPHVHPYLFVGGANSDAITVEEIDADRDDGYAVRYVATRGDLDLDVIETDLGTIGFDARWGIDATSFATLDDFDYPFVRLIPLEFTSTSDTIAFELYFRKRPAFLELRDIYGRGLRFGERPDL